MTPPRKRSPSPTDLPPAKKIKSDLTRKEQQKEVRRAWVLEKASPANVPEAIKIYEGFLNSDHGAIRAQANAQLANVKIGSLKTRIDRAEEAIRLLSILKERKALKEWATKTKRSVEKRLVKLKVAWAGEEGDTERLKSERTKAALKKKQREQVDTYVNLDLEERWLGIQKAKKIAQKSVGVAGIKKTAEQISKEKRAQAKAEAAKLKERKEKKAAQAEAEKLLETQHKKDLEEKKEKDRVRAVQERVEEKAITDARNANTAKKARAAKVAKDAKDAKDAKEAKQDEQAANDEKKSADKAKKDADDVAKEKAMVAKVKAATKKSTAKVRFQYMSDLHMEHPPTNYKLAVPPNAKYLLLGGDIGNTMPKALGRGKEKRGAHSDPDKDPVEGLHVDSTNRQGLYSWLVKQCQQFDRVFWIMGNNEYKFAGTSYNHGSILAEARDWPNFPEMKGKLELLEDDRYDMDDETGATVTILGTTLWSHVSRPGDNQYEQVFGNSERKHEERFQHSFSWLKQAIKDIRKEEGGKDRRILIMTHHAPTMFESSTRTYNELYMTDILRIRQSDHTIKGLGRGDVWMFGHTHICNDFKAGDVRVVTNQRGGMQPKIINQPNIGQFDVTRCFEI